MVINVHKQGPKFWSVGLVRVSGTMPAVKCVELLEKKLQSFGLNLSKDIVAIDTDGASVMVKVGTLISAEQQLCYAHGIQLAVVDVLYKRKRKTTAVAEVKVSELADDGVDDDGEESAGELQVEEISDEYYDMI